VFIALFGSFLFISILISLDSSFSETVTDEFCSTFFSKFQITIGSSSALKFKKKKKKKIIWKVKILF
jgi:hypothetical protein